jgi:dienelactone hydrolase
LSVVLATMEAMTHIALFHPSFGVTPGVRAAAERMRSAGHEVLVVDQYDGRVFDDYDEADRFVQQLGFPELMARALDAVRELPDGFIAAGFSNGGGMAEYVATHRRCGGVVLLSGALPVSMLGASGWPAGVPAQIHYTTGDPRRHQEWLDGLLAEIRAAPAPVELFEYPGTGHLFTDASLPEEYDAAATELLWRRVLAFCAAD